MSGYRRNPEGYFNDLSRRQVEAAERQLRAERVRRDKQIELMIAVGLILFAIVIGVLLAVSTEVI